MAKERDAGEWKALVIQDLMSIKEQGDKTYSEISKLHEKINDVKDRTVDSINVNAKCIAKIETRCNMIQERKKPWINSAISAIVSIVFGVLAAICTMIVGNNN